MSELYSKIKTRYKKWKRQAPARAVMRKELAEERKVKQIEYEGKEAERYKRMAKIERERGSYVKAKAARVKAQPSYGNLMGGSAGIAGIGGSGGGFSIASSATSGGISSSRGNGFNPLPTKEQHRLPITGTSWFGPQPAPTQDVKLANRKPQKPKQKRRRKRKKSKR